jgi:hypothetical protein
MRLAELEPWLLVVSEDGTRYTRTENVAEADGIRFICPGCFSKDGNPIGKHSVICWRPRIPQTIHPTGGRWELEGTSIEDLSLIAGSSSVQLPPPCDAHFWIRNGEVVMA